MGEYYYENLMLADVVRKVGISSGYLSTLFQRQLSKGFVDYLKTYEIAYKVGFRDEKYFSKVFKKIKGQSPSENRLIDLYPSVTYQIFEGFGGSHGLLHGAYSD